MKKRQSAKYNTPPPEQHINVHYFNNFHEIPSSNKTSYFHPIPSVDSLTTLQILFLSNIVKQPYNIYILPLAKEVQYIHMRIRILLQIYDLFLIHTHTLSFQYYLSQTKVVYDSVPVYY